MPIISALGSLLANKSEITIGEDPNPKGIIKELPLGRKLCVDWILSLLGPVSAGVNQLVPVESSRSVSCSFLLVMRFEEL